MLYFEGRVGGNFMSIEKYVVNISKHVVPVGADTVAIISSKKRFCIKGTNIAIVVQNILEYFREPVIFDDVIPILSNKYSAVSLKRMLDLLVDKDILINENESEVLLKHSEAFLEKNFFYTSGGKSLQKIIDELAPLHIGIIGTSQLVHCLLDDLSKSELLTNFHIGIIDREADAKIEQDGVSIVNYPLHSDSSNVQAIIKKSDFVIAASNHYDYYLFNQVNESCYKEGKKWISIAIDGLNAEIGPLFIPGETCCYSCLHTRRRQGMTSEDYIFDDLYMNKQFHERADENSMVFSSLYPLNSLSASIASAEIMKFLTGMKCNLLNQVLMVNCLDFHIQVDYIYKDYMCPICVQKDVVCV